MKNQEVVVLLEDASRGGRRVRSMETELLRMFLVEQLAPGTHLTYAELSDVIEKDVQGEARGALISARKIVEKENGIVTVAIRGVGIYRLREGEVAPHVKVTVRKKLNNACERSLEQLKCVKLEELNNVQLLEHKFTESVTKTLGFMTTAKVQSAIQKKVTFNTVMPTAQLLEHFKRVVVKDGDGKGQKRIGCKYSKGNGRNGAKS